MTDKYVPNWVGGVLAVAVYLLMSTIVQLWPVARQDAQGQRYQCFPQTASPFYPWGRTPVALDCVAVHHTVTVHPLERQR